MDEFTSPKKNSRPDSRITQQRKPVCGDDIQFATAGRTEMFFAKIKHFQTLEDSQETRRDRQRQIDILVAHRRVLFFRPLLSSCPTSCSHNDKAGIQDPNTEADTVAQSAAKIWHHAPTCIQYSRYATVLTSDTQLIKNNTCQGLGKAWSANPLKFGAEFRICLRRFVLCLNNCIYIICILVHSPLILH